jgi:flagellar operon protein
MTQRIDIGLVRPAPVSGRPRPAGTAARDAPADGFAAELAKAGGTGEVAFSAHAAERLSRRGIRIGDADRERLAQAVRAAGEKGGKDSLILLGDVALIVNVPNRTVVTAVGPGPPGERVFTNIDSAVIA